MTKRAQKAVAGGAKPDASAQETERIQADARWMLDGKVNSPPRMEWHEGRLEPEHSDKLGGEVRLHRALGTRSHDFAGVQIGALEFAARQRGKDRGSSSSEINAALAMMGAIAPQNEWEAALGSQIIAAHNLSMELWARARVTERTDHVELYGNMAVKAARTMAAMTETLSKLRTGGKQQVEVVYVDARNSQNIITPGGGGGVGSAGQPLAHALAHSPGAPCPPMRSEVEAERETVPIPGGEGA